MTRWAPIAARISEASGRSFKPTEIQLLGGGCINSASLLGDGRDQWFVKTNRMELADMFEAELKGLEAMAKTRSIRVPRPLCAGIEDGQAFIVMEYLPLGGSASRVAAEAGAQLAAMHQSTTKRHGWHRDNTIGSTPQSNQWHQDWASFWQQERLGYQLDLAVRNGFRGRLETRGRLLQEACPAMLDHAPAASLVHGDLWGGNFGVTQDGTPVIFDPACYQGDRETDIAMTELFGGFSREFRAGYEGVWPLDAGYEVRKTLYNLYHILNHLNLFGSGYAVQAERMIDALLAELG